MDNGSGGNGMQVQRKVAVASLVATVGMLLWALGTPLAASAETSVGTPGSGAGQVEKARGLAVDNAEGLLYVADSGNNRIDVFDADSGAFVKAFGWGVADGRSSELQVCTTVCHKGSAGSGAGQFKGLSGIAVDDDPTSPAFHDVYAYDAENLRVQRFSPAGEFVWMVGGEVDKTTGADLCTAGSTDTCGAGVPGTGGAHFNGLLDVNGTGGASGALAVGPEGVVYAADSRKTGFSGGSNEFVNRVEKFEPSGSYAGEVDVPSGKGEVRAIAVASASEVYVGLGAVIGAAYKLTSGGVQVCKVDPSFNISALAVGSAGELFVADRDEVTNASAVLEFDAGCTPTRTFYGQLESKGVVYGLAPYAGAGGDIFASAEVGGSPSTILHMSFPPAGPVVYPHGSKASPIASVKATLNAEVNPEGKATEYFFEYISDEDFVADGGSFGSGTVTTGTETMAQTDFLQHQVSAGIAGLLPERVYHFRASAINADGGPRTGAAATFETGPPIRWDGVWSSGVQTDSAILHAAVNPLGVAATGRFQYVDQASFEASGFATATEVPPAPEPPLDFGSGEAVVNRSVQIGGLRPGTAYRYRVTVSDRCKPEPAPLCRFVEERGFTTFAPVEPPEMCPNQEFRTGPGAMLPDCRAYEMVSPVEKNGANIEALSNVNGFPASLDQAATDGNSISYSVFKAFGDADSSPYTIQYLARRDPGGGWMTEVISPRREGPTLMGYNSSQLDRQYKAFSADLCSGWVVQDVSPVLAPGAPEGFAGLYRRTNCGPGVGSYEALTLGQPQDLSSGFGPNGSFRPEIQGASADGGVVVFSANDNLIQGLPPQPAACAGAAGHECESRLYEFRPGAGLRPVCVVPNGAVSRHPCGAGTPASSVASAERAGNLSDAVSTDGSRIFWSQSSTSAAAEGPGTLFVRIDGSRTVQVSASAASFWGAATDGSVAIYSEGAQLYEFDVDTQSRTLIAEGLSEGVAGVSDDASRVYFASNDVLTGAEENNEGSKAVEGGRNLYLYEAGVGFRFIATISGPIQNGMSPVGLTPKLRLSRVTPSGEQIAFMSAARLTGYDNADVASKEPDQEVYLYDATADGGKGRLSCVSCNPTGERPMGQQLTLKLLEGVWAAAWIPAYESQLYGQHVLSQEGDRLYFTSSDRLDARDTNGAADVYQWEEPGTGSCTTQKATYHASSGGCVSLISSGQSPQGSELTDIDANGDDVFFTTTASLAEQDPGLLDIYDARVDGGIKESARPAPPCDFEATACQQPGPPPAAGATPQSILPGPGNPPSRNCPKGARRVKRKGKVSCARRPCPKGTHRARRKGKRRCVKIHRSRSTHHRRRDTRKRPGHRGGAA